MVDSFCMDKKDLKILNSLIIPNKIKGNLLSKYSVKDLLDNYKEIKYKILFLSKYNLLDLLYDYRYDEFKEYIFNLKLNDYDSITKINDIYDSASDRIKDFILENIDEKKIKQVLISYYFSDKLIDNLFEKRKSVIEQIILDDKNNDKLEDYFRSDANLKVIKFILDTYTIKEKIDFLFQVRSSYRSGYIEKLYEKELLEYILNDVSSDINKINIYLGVLTSEDLIGDILRSIHLTDDVIEKILKDDHGSRSKAILFELYEKKIKEIIDNDINNRDYQYIFSPYMTEEIVDYFVSNITDDILDDIIKKSYISLRVRESLQKNRINDIIRIIYNKLSSDINLISDYLNDFMTGDIFNSVFKKLDLSDDNITYLLSKDDSRIFGALYKYDAKKILNVVMSYRHDEDFFNKFLKTGYPEDFIDKITSDLSDDELIKIFGHSKIYASKTCLDKLSKKYKKELMKIFYDNIESNIGLVKELLIFDSDFKTNVVHEVEFEHLIKLFKTFGTNEKEFIFNKYKDKFREYINILYKSDVIKFYSEFIESYSYLISEDAIQMLNEEDAIKIFKSKVEKRLFYLDKNLHLLLTHAINKYAKDIMNDETQEWVNFVKGLRYNFDDMFKLFLFNLDMNDDILYKLFTERGLSDDQKKILYSLYKDQIDSLVLNRLEEDDWYNFLQKGTPNEVLNKVLDKVDPDKLKELLHDKDFVNRHSIGEKFAIKLALTLYQSDDNKTIIQDLMNNYNKNKFKLVLNFEIIQDFLISINYDQKNFWQYSLNNSYDFIDDITYIYTYDLDVFKNVYEYLINNVYKDNNCYFADILLLIVKNFRRYRELMVSLLDNDELSSEDISNLKILFNHNDTMSNKPSNNLECHNIIYLIIDNYRKELDKCKSVDDYKNIIFNMLFNFSLEDSKTKLSTYGNVGDLIELSIINKNNNVVRDKINEVSYYTDTIQKILVLDDLDYLRNLALEILNNYEVLIQDDRFTSYDLLMKELYSLEMDSNLTKIDDSVSEDFVLDKEKAKKYGVKVFDFRDKAYIMLAHVLSKSETIDSLMNGISNGNQNFISLSAVSYRNQAYYYGANNIIFGCDFMPSQNFICSSKSNMGSNGAIKKNSNEVNDLERVQRGVLEISDANGNSEILTLRNGLTFKYIIIPEGQIITQKEIDIAKKYNLTICLTQAKNKGIEDPRRIPKASDELANLREYRSYLINSNNDLVRINNNDRIAILTDIHGLIEPTIAVLEDIRKKGIKEIYSLGDNIGTGPNPNEVVSLLDQYGVKSIKGNHELYLLNGLDTYKEHLDKTGSFETEKVDHDWNEEVISEANLNLIRNYYDYIELELDGNKVLLCHYLYDYNTDRLLYDPNAYHKVIQGHMHFPGEDTNIFTLKAAGIGNKDKNDIGQATYLELYVDDGELKYDVVTVPFDIKNTLNAINVSDSKSKVKIKKWVGSSK